jgi:hypothetical protein
VALLRSVRDDDYWPEYGTLVLRDGAGPQVVAMPAGYDPTDQAPAGTVAIGGFGWLHLRTSAEPQRVLIEVHDSQPNLAGDGWDDIQEVPYFSATATISIETLMGRPDAPSTTLNVAGLHRVRVSRRARDTWLIQIWPVAEPADPPVWMRRSTPLTESTDRGWATVLEHDADHLRSIVGTAAGTSGVTPDELAAWGTAHHWRAGWLDEPLEPDLPVPPGRLLRAELAGQLGLPEPASRRELLAVLAAAGVLSFEERTGRYRSVGILPAVPQVLELTEAQLHTVEAADKSQRFGLLLADVICLAAWSPPRLDLSLSRLAERLLAPPDVVHDTILYGEQCGLLDVGALPDAAAPDLTVTLSHRVPLVG